MSAKESILQGKRILIVDDEPDVRGMIHRVLSREGCEVVEVGDGIECMAALHRCPAFDLILLDILMPNKEGLETIVEVRRDFPHAKILAISGGGKHGLNVFLSTAQAFGAQGILKKPFSHQELLQNVTEILTT